MRPHLTVLLLAAAPLLGGVASPPPNPGPGSLTLRVVPPVVEMGPFYSGAEMHMEGFVAEGSRLVVVVRGGERQEVFNRKRKAGPIWVTSGKVRISGVPTTFLRFTSGALRTFLGREAIELHQIDEASIRHQMILDPDRDHDLMVANWLKLKAEEGTFGLYREGVKRGAPGPQGVPYTVDFHWPQKAPPGRYQVSVYEIRNGAVVGVLTQPLPAVKVGFAGWLSRMGTERALLYGILAVIIAAIAGFGIDLLSALIFGKKRAPAH